MSTTTTVIYGYGVGNDLTSLARTMDGEKIVDFLKKHLPETFETMKEEVNEQTTKAYMKWLKGFSCGQSGIEGVFAVVSTAMTKETGIRFEYQSNDHDSIIVFSETFPWIQNEVERELTTKRLDELFEAYFKELDVDVSPGTINIEYYG